MRALHLWQYVWCGMRSWADCAGLIIRCYRTRCFCLQAACAIEVCIDEQLQRVTHQVRQRRALEKAAAQVTDGHALLHSVFGLSIGPSSWTSTK